MTPNKRVEEAIDHKRHALRQAIKGIVPPPYMLQVGDIEALRQNGFTGTTAHIENQRRQDEYENTVNRTEKYITETLTQYHQDLMSEVVERIKELPAFTCCSDKCMGKVSDEAKKPKWGTNYLERETVIKTLT